MFEMRIVAVFAALLILAGCVGDGGAGAGTGPPSSQDPQSVNPENLEAGTGGIAGTVINDETAPVAGAMIGLDQNAAITTDESGMFQIANVPPGRHDIQVQALGYMSIGRSVEVAEGEFLQLILTVSKLPVDEPYLEVIILKGFSICDYMVWVISGRLPAPCDSGQAKSEFTIPVNATWDFLVAELQWQGGFANSDTFRFFTADDGDCVDESPCYGLKYGRGYIKLEGEPGDTEMVKHYDPWMDDRGPGYPEKANGSFDLVLNAQWIGAFASELGQNPACQAVLQAAAGSGYKEGCLGAGVSTGIAFDAYVSIFHLMRPDPIGQCCPTTTYSAIPDG